MPKPTPTQQAVLYHGTRAPFRGGGGLVLPGADVGRENHNLGRSDRVYVTPDLELAWLYAEASKGRGKPKVLIVEPRSPLEVDDSTIGNEEQEAYSCAYAVVQKVLTR
jgi:hypothetical protein